MALPKLSLRLRFITNPALKLIEARSGALHIADNIPPTDHAMVERDGNLSLLKVPPGVMLWIAFNTQKDP